LFGVLDPPTTASRTSLVAAGDDRIPHAHHGSGRRFDTAGADIGGQDPVGSGAVVEVQHGLGVARDHQRTLARASNVAPRFVKQVEHGLPVPALDPAVFGVGVGCVGATVAQIDRGRAFPLVAESAYVMQLRHVVPIRDEQVERPTR
jgi:hypothetical protein